MGALVDIMVINRREAFVEGGAPSKLSQPNTTQSCIDSRNFKAFWPLMVDQLQFGPIDRIVLLVLQSGQCTPGVDKVEVKPPFSSKA